MSCMLPLSGHGGDKSDLTDIGLHVFLSRDHQREGKGGTAHLFRPHRDDAVFITRECHALNPHRTRY